MPTRSIVIAVALAAGLFGLLAAGCNNGKRTARAPRSVRSQQLASARAVRPAEVLAATAHRAQTPERPERASVVGTRISEPLPEPVVLAQSGAPRNLPLARPAAAPAPAFHSVPATAPRSVGVPGPELAMARSGLSPMTAPAARAGYRAERLPFAPIPELEPVSLRRMPSTLTTRRPAAEVMMSSRSGPDLRHALAPLGGEADIAAGQDWVPSPTTAMLHY